MVDPRDEFISEAQEIIEGLGRDLLALDAALKREGGRIDPELVNDAFRAVHTLKGLSSLFGVPRMATLSHHLEDRLDDLRLGRLQLTAEVLDVLFTAVEVYHHMLSALRSGDEGVARLVDDLVGRVEGLGRKGPIGVVNPLVDYDLDPGLLSVLTEYEEHRLRVNLEQGVGLFKIRVKFELTTIDGALDGLKTRAKPHGEILTYLPSGEVSDPDYIELDVLLASRQTLEVLQSELGGPQVVIEAIARRSNVRQGPRNVGQTPDLAGKPQGDHDLDEGRRITRPPAALDEEHDAHTGHGGAGPTPPIGRNPGLSSPRSPMLSPLAGDDPDADLSIRAVAQTVRVDIRKLDHLMNIVAELSIVRTTLGRISDRVRGQPELRGLGHELHRLNRSLERHLGELQGGILEVRMVPLGQVFDKLARVVRQISREHDKEIHLVITGGETEVDKLIVEELSDPLMHMMRNAIDHGIEARPARLTQGKPDTGTIALNAYQKGNHVVIELQDDGAGIDEERVLTQAVRRGLISEDEAATLTSREIFGFIFLPGFSTKAGVDELSGRGVGMDVVKTNIGKLGGVIDVQSELGIGTKMTVTLPITLAIISALVIVVAGRRYALPLSSVLEALLFDTSQVRSIEGREVMTLRGQTLALCRLETLFGLPPIDGSAPRNSGSQRRFVVVIGVGDQRVGCIADSLIGQQDIVIKALGKSLQSVRGFSGATELGDQHVGLVIDAGALVEDALAGTDSLRHHANHGSHGNRRLVGGLV